MKIPVKVAWVGASPTDFSIQDDQMKSNLFPKIRSENKIELFRSTDVEKFRTRFDPESDEFSDSFRFPVQSDYFAWGLICVAFVSFSEGNITTTP